MALLSCLILLAAIVYALNLTIGPHSPEDDDDGWGW